MRIRRLLLCCPFLFLVDYITATASSDRGQCSFETFSPERDTVYIETVQGQSAEVYRLCLDKEGRKHILFELETAIGDSLDFLYCGRMDGARAFDCFAAYDNTADGSRFLFFDYKYKTLYITSACVSGFYPLWNSVDFMKKQVVLENEYCHSDIGNDTLNVGREKIYVPFHYEPKFIKASLVPVSPVN